MEFHEKIQELRKRKGITQEELAEQLFVSRTAVSKWESGRGFPNIESLKTLSVYFGISLDELLSGEELLAIVEKDHKEMTRTIRELVFGLLDCGMLLLLFLPFFGQKTKEAIQAVALLNLCERQPYLKAAYLVFSFAMLTSGILLLALQNVHQHIWLRGKYVLSVTLSAAGVCLFVISQQPYAAIFTFVFLMIKTFMLLKGR